MLRLSEIRLMWLFFTSERSKFERPGPIRLLRPAFPIRVAGMGNEKHCVLMYCNGLPELTADSQPDPKIRSGKSKGYALSRPRGSPPITGVNGRPLLT